MGTGGNGVLESMQCNGSVIISQEIWIENILELVGDLVVFLCSEEFYYYFYYYSHFSPQL